MQPGNTVYSIAALYQVDVNRIIYDNQLIYPYQSAVGQALLIAGGVGEKHRQLKVMVMRILLSADGCFKIRFRI